MAHPNISTAAPQRKAAPGPAGREWDLGAWSNPVTGVLALYLAGIVLYPFDLPWWAVALVAAGAGTALTWSVRKAAFRTLAVVYTGACAGVAAVWLTFASQLLTFDIFHIVRTGKCLLALVGACLPLAIIYFVLLAGHGRAIQAAYLAEQEKVQRRSATVAALSAAKVRGWALIGESADEARTTTDFEIQPGGTTLTEALSMLDRLEIALRAPFKGAVRLERPVGGHVGQVRLTCARRSVLSELVPIPTAPAEPRSILEPLPTGRFEDGETAAEVYAYTSTTSIGQRDSGKTMLQNIMIDGFASCDDCLIFIIDFKEGSTVRPWLEPYATGQVERPVFDWVGFTVADIHAMVAELNRIAATRARGRKGDKINPSADLPAIRLIIDEVADLTAGADFDTAKAAAIKLLIQVLRKHRSEGVDVDLATQRATMSFLGNNARDILSQAVHQNILRVDSPAEVFNTLQTSMDKLGGVDPSEFSEPGSILTIRPGSRRAVRRAYYLPTEAIGARAVHYAARRPVLEATAIDGASAAYRNRWTNTRVRALLDSIRDNKPLDAYNDNDHTATTTSAPAEQAAGTTLVAPAPAPSNGQIGALQLRASLHEAYGTDEGERRYHLARGKVALRVMTDHIRATGAEAAPTRDLIDALTAHDPTMFDGLDGKALGALLAAYRVAPAQIGAGLWGTNARGYRLADLTAGLDREPTDDQSDGTPEEA